MTNILKSIVTIVFIAGMATSCKKKESGICYCKYVNGDKKEFDMRSLDRSKALDSCNNKTNKNANAFGGECELK